MRATDHSNPSPELFLFALLQLCHHHCVANTNFVSINWIEQIKFSFCKRKTVKSFMSLLWHFISVLYSKRSIICTLKAVEKKIPNGLKFFVHSTHKIFWKFKPLKFIAITYLLVPKCKFCAYRRNIFASWKSLSSLYTQLKSHVFMEAVNIVMSIIVFKSSFSFYSCMTWFVSLFCARVNFRIGLMQKCHCEFYGNTKSNEDVRIHTFIALRPTIALYNGYR